MIKKVIIVGVGNSGTKILGTIVNEILKNIGMPDYHYEPLYWSGNTGESGIVLNPEAIEEHKKFPLIPYPDQRWPWLEDFLENLEGLAKFIRLGSRINLIIDKPIKIIWITRELFSYLASLLNNNFPMCLPDAGWHHRPGQYDDFERLCKIYPGFDLQRDEIRRVEVEATWWLLHNSAVLPHNGKKNLLHIRYEDLCSESLKTVESIIDFLEISNADKNIYKFIRPINNQKLNLFPENILKIDMIAGDLNRKLYGYKSNNNR